MNTPVALQMKTPVTLHNYEHTPVTLFQLPTPVTPQLNMHSATLQLNTHQSHFNWTHTNSTPLKLNTHQSHSISTEYTPVTFQLNIHQSHSIWTHWSHPIRAHQSHSNWTHTSHTPTEHTPATLQQHTSVALHVNTPVKLYVYTPVTLHVNTPTHSLWWRPLLGPLCSQTQCPCTSPAHTDTPLYKHIFKTFHAIYWNVSETGELTCEQNGHKKNGENDWGGGGGERWESEREGVCVLGGETVRDREKDRTRDRWVWWQWLQRQKTERDAEIESCEFQASVQDFTQLTNLEELSFLVVFALPNAETDK